jgi:hypothetical protein
VQVIRQNYDGVQDGRLLAPDLTKGCAQQVNLRDKKVRPAIA